MSSATRVDHGNRAPVDATVRSPSRKDAFRPDIEGLRGVAVAIVVAFHCSIPGFSGGFIGVDVFFVLSGYLITGHLVAEIQRTSRLSLLNFYARRARRLLPASALVLACTVGASALLLAPQEIEFAGRAARATAVYLNNAFFYANAADYFAPNVETNPFLHMWTLAVEEQFYFVWPVLIMIGLHHFRSRRRLLQLLIGLTVLSFGVSLWATTGARSFAFYLLPSRAWEFAVGGLAALIPRGKLPLSRVTWTLLGCAGLAMVVGFEFFATARSAFPGWVALIPVLGTSAVLVAGIHQPRDGVARLLDSVPLQFLGRLSYSWYLWHWPFLVFAAALRPTISVLERALVAVLSLAVAALAYRWIENPVRLNAHLGKRPRLTLVLAAGLMIVSFSLAQLSLRFADRLVVDPGLQRIAASVNDIADMSRKDCVSLSNSTNVLRCTFGDTLSAMTIVLFGDSHAIQWFNPVRGIAIANSWKLTTFLKSGCSATDVVLGSADRGFTEACNTWRKAAIQSIVALHPTLVVVASSTGWQRSPADEFPRELREWTDGLSRTLTMLSATPTSIVVMRDTPISPFDVPTCLARSLRHAWYPGGECEFPYSAAIANQIFEAEKGTARARSNVRFLDMTPQLCHGTTCLASSHGMVMYRDDNHLTGKFAATLQAALNADFVAKTNAR